MFWQYVVWTGIIMIACAILAMFDDADIKKDVEIEKNFKYSRSIVCLILNVIIATLIYFAGQSDVARMFNSPEIWVITTPKHNIILNSINYTTQCWLFFDLFLNIFRKKSLGYISDDNEDYNDVPTDTFFHRFGRYGGDIQITFKLTIIVLMYALS